MNSHRTIFLLLDLSVIVVLARPFLSAGAGGTQSLPTVVTYAQIGSA